MYMYIPMKVASLHTKSEVWVLYTLTTMGHMYMDMHMHIH